MRFKDDVFVIAEDAERYSEFLRILQKRAQFFVVNEEQRTTEFLPIATFLNLKILRFNDEIRFLPFMKERIGAWLQPASAHPPSCHLAWTGAIVRNIGMLSSSEEYAERAKSRFLE